MPNFIDELTILDIDLGKTIPLIKNTHEPWSDEKGLWAHLDVDYNGGFKMSLATKLNLMSLKKYKLADANSELVENKLEVQPRARHLGRKEFYLDLIFCTLYATACANRYAEFR